MHETLFLDQQGIRQQGKELLAEKMDLFTMLCSASLKIFEETG